MRQCCLHQLAPHVFLDPRMDDPLEFMEFDPQTGMFVEINAPHEPGYARAAYTLRVLGLNERDYLKRARKNAYKTWLTLAEKYRDMKLADAPKVQLQEALRHLQAHPFPSVWAEIKREATQRASHQAIFSAAPELLAI